LEREAKAQRDLFESYLAKYREASARDSIAAAPADARIISRASVSNLPYYPKKVPIVLIGTVVAFSLSSAFVVASALMSAPSRQAPLQIDNTPPVLGERRAARSRNARTRITDRLAGAAPAPEPPAASATAPRAAGPSIDEVGAGLRQAGEGG